MARPASRHPTELELEILKVLWKDGPLSVRQVRDALAPTRDLAYTSVMTMLGIMTDKGYLGRTKGQGGYIYKAKVSAEVTTRGMLRDLLNRAFEGSAAALVLNLLDDRNVSEQELHALRELIDRKAKEARP